MLEDLQRALLRELLGDGPVDDGRLLTRLLIRKLRFERICRGSRAAEAWFEREPETFTAAFRAYDRDVPPREYFPRDEAAAFREYCRENPNLRAPADVKEE